MNVERGSSYSSTFSLTSATDKGGWLTSRPCRFTSEKGIRCPFYRRLGGPQGRLGGCGKCRPHGYFFLYSLVLCSCFIRTSFFLCPDCPGFYLVSLLYDTQHKHPCPRRDSNPQPQQATSRRSSP